MTDLFRVLPHFPDGQFAHLIQVLDRHGVTTADLLTLDIADIGKRTQLPLLDVSRLSNAVFAALHRDLGVSRLPAEKPSPLKHTLTDLTNQPSAISTLDDELNRVLGGGIPTGYVTEITGESGVGKTQFLLSLMLAVQLPPPAGLGRRALYMSTEAPLSTTRLRQILSSNPLLLSLPQAERPTTDAIIVGSVADLESQEHILRFQVPVEVERSNIGILVLDSVTANYRAEFERGAAKNYGSNMGARTGELIRMGALLRDLAQKYNLAVVVANQVADRFSSPAVPMSSSRMAPPRSSFFGGLTQESPLASRSKGPPQVALDALEPPSSMAEHFRSSMPEPPGLDEAGTPALPALGLDHQQRWFTGWGDDPFADYGLKTPALGLVWSTQIACRIALFRKAVYGAQSHLDDEDRGLPTVTSWRRWMKVVFAPHVQATGQGLDGAIEYKVSMRGLQSVKEDATG